VQQGTAIAMQSCVFLNDNKYFFRGRSREFFREFAQLVPRRLLAIPGAGGSDTPLKKNLLSITDATIFLCDKVGELRSLFLGARLWRAYTSISNIRKT